MFRTITIHVHTFPTVPEMKIKPYIVNKMTADQVSWNRGPSFNSSNSFVDNNEDTFVVFKSLILLVFILNFFIFPRLNFVTIFTTKLSIFTHKLIPCQVSLTYSLILKYYVSWIQLFCKYRPTLSSKMFYFRKSTQFIQCCLPVYDITKFFKSVLLRRHIIRNMLSCK